MNFLITFLKSIFVDVLCNVIQLFMLNPIVLTVVKHHVQSLETLTGYGYVLRTGCQWASLPVKNGCWKTIYHYFAKWSKAHVFEQAHQDLVKFYTKRGLSRDVVVDTSFVKNVWGRDCLGKSPVDRGRKATKVSVITDALGTPLQFLFHPGNKNDSRSLPHLLDRVSMHLDITGKHIYADRIYDSSYCTDAVPQILWCIQEGRQ